ncbi:MAG: hypothetical protein JRN58_05090 [Nitrososphaerota archaeon]|jgi:hypothetical protein|nr:hypothetical protein [Nitrososphaerota archaeon]MDG6967360.1 hypothetical protein [Nitrososphaerota archaeon]MDG6968553.1 hypothetical protein [Nitrososphaerota archaeon]MDG6978438.1 hypothetical protein [Nitrososphaerota archaeon]
MSILFVCIENSSGSVLAECSARSICLEASSAGTVPAAQVDLLGSRYPGNMRGRDRRLRGEPNCLTREVIAAMAGVLGSR